MSTHSHANGTAGFYQEPGSLSIPELLSTIWRQKAKLAVSVAIVAVPICIYSFQATAVYESTATVAVENYGKDSIIGFELTSPLSRASILANQIKEAQTIAFARSVLEALPGHARDRFLVVDSAELDLASATAALRDRLTVKSVAGTDFIALTFASPDPGQAALVSNTAARVLQENNVANHRKKHANLRGFIETQLALVSDRLAGAEDALSGYKESENLTSVDTESREVLQRITHVESLLNTVGSDLEAARNRLALLNSQLDSQKKNLASDIVRIADPLTGKLKERLVELSLQLSDLSARGLPDNHPKVVELNRELSQARQKLVRTTLEIAEEDSRYGVIDPLAQLKANLEEAIRLDVQVRALESQQASLRNTLAGYRKRVNTFPVHERNILRLSRDKEINNRIFVKLLEEREQARIREAAEIGNIRLVEAAVIPEVPARPRRLLNAVLGIIAGTIFGLAWILGTTFMQDTVRTPEESELALGMPTLAAVPRINRSLLQHAPRDKAKTLIHSAATPPLLRDAFACLWNALAFRLKDSPQVVTVTSATSAEGKSTVAANLALFAAQRGLRTILIDGDIRNPVLHKMFNAAPAPGLCELAQALRGLPDRPIGSREPETVPNGRRVEAYLAETASLVSRETELYDTFRSKLQRVPSLKNIRIMAAGTADADPRQIWEPAVISQIFATLKKAADFIVVDAPPLLGMPDAECAAGLSDAVLLCVESAKSRKPTLERAKQAFERLGVRCLGVVLNKVEPATIYGSHKNYKHYARHYA